MADIAAGADAEDSSSSSCFAALVDWDRRTSERMAVCSSPDAPWGRARGWTRLLEYSGHGVPWLAGALGAAVMADDAPKRDVRLNLLWLLIFDIVVLLVCKAIFRRPRPAYNVKDNMMLLSDVYSFPSGHATRATAATIFIAREFHWGHTSTALLLAWMVMCCASRVLLGRHHILDVFAGMVVGALEYLVLKRYLWLSSEICDMMMKTR